MKKKLSYIYGLALIVTIVSLFRFVPQHQYMCDPVECPPVSDSRGFPFMIPLGDYRYTDGSTYRLSNNLPLIANQAAGLTINTVFYFLIFSTIYFVIISPIHFVYSRFIKKGKKK